MKLIIMRRRFTPLIRSFLLILVFNILASSAAGCSRFSPISLDEIFFEADAIVRATAVRYVIAPKPNYYTTGTPESTIEFKVQEVLSGLRVSGTLVINGYLSDKDDFNDRPVPYDFVRPLGRRGSCYANEYKSGAEFLLFLKKSDSGFTPNWNALAPTNEQLKSVQDPWLVWARDYISSSEGHPSQERELRKLTRKWDEAIIRGDVDMLNRLLADDYSVSFYSKEMYIAGITVPEVKWIVARKDGVRVRIFDGTAVITGRNTLTREVRESGQRSNTFNFMDVWVRRGNEWRCVATMSEQ